jgi:hypothetical protein
MSSLNEVLGNMKEEGFDLVREQFMGLLGQAKEDKDEIAKKTAEKMERWLVMLASEDLDREEFEALVEGRARTVRQHLNTLEIEARVRVEKVTIGLIKIAVDKIVPILPV